MDKKTIGLFSSRGSDDWETPRWLYDKLDEEFHFDFDPCPIEPDFDGLSVPWGGNIFVNPPYSRVAKWLAKGREELGKGNAKVVVFLVFANTDARWFHEYIYGKAEIRFLKGRIKFRNKNKPTIGHSAMRPSMVVIFRPIQVDGAPLNSDSRQSWDDWGRNRYLSVQGFKTTVATLLQVKFLPPGIPALRIRMSQENIDRGRGSLLKAIDELHRDDRVFYWRMVYQDKGWNAKLVREINLLMVDADPKNGDSKQRLTMKREEVLKRVNDKISQLEKILEARTEPLWSGVAVYMWKDDLEFYRHIRSLIEGENK